MELAALALIALAAFTVEGAIGFGSTVIAVSFGAQLVPLEVLLPAFVPLNLVLSLTLLRRPIAWRVLAVEIAPVVALGMAAGLALAHVLASRALLVAFGCFVVALSAWQLAGRTTRTYATPLLALGGIVHGLFGTGGPMVVYVARKKIADKTVFRSTLAVLWITLNVALIASFASRGHTPDPTLLLALAAAIVPGRLVGEHLHRALDTRRFERLVWIVLAFAGAALALRSL
jgi:hypothetical protein